MNPSKTIRDEALSLFGQTLQEHPDLVQILVGHIDDGDSLAHQSMVYFMLHLLEVDMPLSALAGTPENAALLVASLIATANNERHYAPITALIRLVYHPSSRSGLAPLSTSICVFLYVHHVCLHVYDLCIDTAPGTVYHLPGLPSLLPFRLCMLAPLQPVAILHCPSYSCRGSS